MITIPRVAALAFLLALGAPASSAVSTAYDVKVEPLDELSRDLLTTNGYELREDGKVWDKISEAPVRRDDMSYLLGRLAGARRLKALLELNLILNRSGDAKKPSGEDLENLRAVARQNWSVLNVSTRRDLRSYFSLRELEDLDKIPQRFDTSSALSSMKDPEPGPAAAAAPDLPPAVAAPPSPAPAPAPLEVGVFKPWTPPAASTGAAATAVEPVAAASSAPVAVEPPPPPPAKPTLPEVTAERYDAFVAEGPYTAEGKALLQLLGQKAPDHCLPLLRRTVVSAMPQIVLDGARTGVGLRAGTFVDPAAPEAPVVLALSPGAVYVERKSGLFGPRRTVLVAESPAAYAELGVALPSLDALRKDAVPTSTENGPWGATKFFADGSRRGSYSVQEQAGELLEQILLLGLRREGLSASAYAAKRWARTARLLFSARLKTDLGSDRFLDPDRRAELREWLERPEEADDETMASWTASRLFMMDPRRGTPEGARDFESRARASCVRTSLEDSLAAAAAARARRVGTLDALLAAGLVPSAEARAAVQAATDEESSARKRLLASPPACPAPEGRDEGLRRAALLAAESARVERAFREKIASGEDHAR